MTTTSIPVCAIQDCDTLAVTTLPVHKTGLTVTLVTSGRADKNIPVCSTHRTALFTKESGPFYLSTKEDNTMPSATEDTTMSTNPTPVCIDFIDADTPTPFITCDKVAMDCIHNSWITPQEDTMPNNPIPEDWHGFIVLDTCPDWPMVIGLGGTNWANNPVELYAPEEHDAPQHVHFYMRKPEADKIWNEIEATLRSYDTLLSVSFNDCPNCGRDTKSTGSDESGWCFDCLDDKDWMIRCNMCDKVHNTSYCPEDEITITIHPDQESLPFDIYGDDLGTNSATEDTLPEGIINIGCHDWDANFQCEKCDEYLQDPFGHTCNLTNNQEDTMSNDPRDITIGHTTIEWHGTTPNIWHIVTLYDGAMICNTNHEDWDNVPWDHDTMHRVTVGEMLLQLGMCPKCIDFHTKKEAERTMPTTNNSGQPMFSEDPDPMGEGPSHEDFELDEACQKMVDQFNRDHSLDNKENNMDIIYVCNQAHYDKLEESRVDTEFEDDTIVIDNTKPCCICGARYNDPYHNQEDNMTKIIVTEQRPESLTGALQQQREYPTLFQPGGICGAPTKKGTPCKVPNCGIKLHLEWHATNITNTKEDTMSNTPIPVCEKQAHIDHIAMAVGTGGITVTDFTECVVCTEEDYTDWSMELENATPEPVVVPVLTSGVKCGNTKVHGSGGGYHPTPAEVKACYMGQTPPPAPVSTNVPTPKPVTPASATEKAIVPEVTAIPITETGPTCGNPIHGKEKVRHASIAAIKACYGVAPQPKGNATADALEKAYFGSGRTIKNPFGNR